MVYKKSLNHFIEKWYFFCIVTKYFAKFRFLRVPSLNDFFFFLQFYNFFNFGESVIQNLKNIGFAKKKNKKKKKNLKIFYNLYIIV